MQDKSDLGWVIRDSNDIIKMGWLYDILTAKNNLLNKGYSNLDIEGDSKIDIDRYNEMINIFGSIMLSMEDIWKLSQGLHTYECQHAYKKVNRIINCLAKKGISIIDFSIWLANFPKDVINISL